MARVRFLSLAAALDDAFDRDFFIGQNRAMDATAPGRSTQFKGHVVAALVGLLAATVCRA